MIKGLEHVGIYCTDSKAYADWCCKMFEMKIVSDNGKGIYFTKGPGDFMFEIIPTEDPAKQQGLKDHGLRHLALYVENEDFEPMKQKLIDEGVEIVMETPEDSDPHNLFFRDIEGNIMHIITRKKLL